MFNPKDINQALKKILSLSGGNRPWRNWKERSLLDIVDLAKRSPRMELLAADLSGEFNLLYKLKMPVPREPVDGRLQIGTEAVFHLRYAPEWISESPEGWLPLGLLEPRDPFHGNVKASMRGAICLGDLPAAIPPSEIIMLGYYTMTLQIVMLDETDPHGVLNRVACEYFRANAHLMPLTEDGFSAPVSLDFEQ